MISAAVIGAVVGLVIGIADFVVLGAAARNSAASRGGALRFIRLMSLVVFPIVGWFVGPIIATSLFPSSLGG
jgi:hypothetical protein